MSMTVVVHIWCSNMPFETGKASVCCCLAQVTSNM